MGTGANVGSFAGGFGKGLANAMLHNRQREDEKRRQSYDQEMRMFSGLFPEFMANAADDDEIFNAQAATFMAQFPTLAGGGKQKKGTSPFDNIRKYFGPLLGMRGQQQTAEQLPPSNQPPGVTGGTLDTLVQPIGSRKSGQPLPMPIGSKSSGVPLQVGQVVQPIAQDISAGQADSLVNFGTPATGAATAGSSASSPGAPARRTLMGVPIPSADERLTRDINRRKILIDRARSTILPALKTVDPTATIEDALAMIATGQMAKTGRSATPFQSVKGKTADGKVMYGTFDQSSGQFVDPITRQPLAGFAPVDDTGGATFGVDREALARAMYGKPFGDLDQAQQQAVIGQEQDMLRKESKARGTGTAQARFEAPIDVSTAQDTGTQVGASSADYAGQNVAPLAVAERRRSLDVLRTEVNSLLTGSVTDEKTGAVTPGLLDVLPSKNELGGVAPGAVYAARKRMNSHREAAARLEAVVDGMVNTLARLKNEQRGAQTEQDAIRAYNTVVALQAGFLDPFGGDTRESAQARIKETVASIDRVIAGLPASPVARPRSGAPGPSNPPGGSQPGRAPAASGTGLKMDAKGNILDAAGNVVVPAQ